MHGRPPAGPLQGCRALEGYLAWEAHRKTFHPQAQQASPPRQGFAGTPIARRTPPPSVGGRVELSLHSHANSLPPSSAPSAPRTCTRAYCKHA